MSFNSQFSCMFIHEHWLINIHIWKIGFIKGADREAIRLNLVSPYVLFHVFGWTWFFVDRVADTMAHTVQYSWSKFAYFKGSAKFVLIHWLVGPMLLGLLLISNLYPGCAWVNAMGTHATWHQSEHSIWWISSLFNHFELGDE